MHTYIEYIRREPASPWTVGLIRNLFQVAWRGESGAVTGGYRVSWGAELPLTVGPFIPYGEMSYGCMLCLNRRVFMLGLGIQRGWKLGRW